MTTTTKVQFGTLHPGEPVDSFGDGVDEATARRVSVRDGGVLVSRTVTFTDWSEVVAAVECQVDTSRRHGAHEGLLRNRDGSWTCPGTPEPTTV
jgi:hypothetical protein